MKSNRNLAGFACTGCAACASACRHDAISMVADSAGFLHPQIDAARCVNCGLCETGCPVLHMPSASEKTDAYAAYASDPVLTTGSSSGAVFSLLAKAVLSQSGIVFGAAFDDAFNVKHVGVESLDELQKLCSSKYVQSEIGQTFREAKAALDAGRMVYFSGTPCQIAGLRVYLGKDHENLITQDLICHSVPSPKVWADYLHTLEETHHGKMASFSFRYKHTGWEGYHIRAVFENRTEEHHPAAEDPYEKGFIKGLYSRPSCYTCPFKGIQRVSDITLADFWGVKHLLPEAYHPQGTSLVLLHTQKAERLFASIQSEMFCTPADAEAAVIYNTAAVVPIAKPKRYQQFWDNYGKMEFSQLVTECCAKTLGEKRTEAWHRSIPCRGMRKIMRLIKKNL